MSPGEKRRLGERNGRVISSETDQGAGAELLGMRWTWGSKETNIIILFTKALPFFLSTYIIF